MKIEFSNHAFERLKKRGILQIYIEEELLHPIRVEKREGLFYAQIKIDKGIVEIVYEKRENLIKIVTLYWI